MGDGIAMMAGRRVRMDRSFILILIDLRMGVKGDVPGRLAIRWSTNVRERMDVDQRQ
jgi:hypothetical protein